MKAKIQALIVLSVLCVFLAAVYVLAPEKKSAVSVDAGGDASSVNQGQTQTPAEGQTENILITDIPVSEVKAMMLSNERVTFGIMNSPEGVSAVPGSGDPFTEEEMRGLVYLACHLTAIRLLDNMPLPDESEIEKSPARFSLILGDGREYNFIILGKSPVDENYLLYSQGQESVFLISPDDARWFLGDAGDL